MAEHASLAVIAAAIAEAVTRAAAAAASKTEVLSVEELWAAAALPVERLAGAPPVAVKVEVLRPLSLAVPASEATGRAAEPLVWASRLPIRLRAAVAALLLPANRPSRPSR